MFARIKKSGRNEYWHLAENHREGEKIKQRVVATIGRMDELRESGNIETIIRSLSRFYEKVLLIFLPGVSPMSKAPQRRSAP